MKNFLFILILLITSCGYQPIYINKNPDNFKFKNITLNGNKEINRKIISALSIEKDGSSANLNKRLILDSYIKIVETSKDSKGKVTTYKSIGEVNITIEEKGKLLKNKNFSEDFTYNNYDNKFDLVEYQKEVETIIINKIIEEINIYLNL